MKVRSPLEIYMKLPRTNCGECGEKTCMAFAAKLMERSAKLDACRPLLKDGKKFEELSRLLEPQIKEISIGRDPQLIIGGDDVMHRHELSFFNKTAIACDVWDTMDDDKLVERVKKIENFTKIHIGKRLKLDAVAVRCSSGDPDRFSSCVRKVMEITRLPLLLCALNPDAMRKAVEFARDRRPLIYAATVENWIEMGRIAKENDLPLVAHSPDLSQLKSLCRSLLKYGVKDLVLDPGTDPVSLGYTMSKFVQLRRAGIEGDEDLRFPLMCVPANAHLLKEDGACREAIVASLLIVKYADIMVLHSMDPHVLLPVVTLREHIYADPRKHPAVEKGLKIVGSPKEDSPVLITTNFALTYYTVENDVRSGNVDCYILVLDTGGLGVEVSVAGKQFTASLVKKTLEEVPELSQKVKHRTLVIPGLAARLSDEIRDETGWNVMIGPKDSAQIPAWMKSNWPPS